MGIRITEQDYEQLLKNQRKAREQPEPTPQPIAPQPTNSPKPYREPKPQQSVNKLQSAWPIIWLIIKYATLVALALSLGVVVIMIYVFGSVQHQKMINHAFTAIKRRLK